MKHKRFGSLRIMYAGVIAVSFFKGGAVEPFCHAHSKRPHRILADITLDMCVKFHDCRAIPSP